MPIQRSIVRVACLLMLVVGTATASDNVLRKCVAADGSVTYQNAACASRSEAAWERPFEAEAVAAPVAARPDAMPARRHADSRAPAGGASRTSDRERRAAECQAAKARRKQTLDQVGLRRTYELLSQLDRDVFAACKGVDR
jgi:hypothetical protein